MQGPYLTHRLCDAIHTPLRCPATAWSPRRLHWAASWAARCTLEAILRRQCRSLRELSFWRLLRGSNVQHALLTEQCHARRTIFECATFCDASQYLWPRVPPFHLQDATSPNVQRKKALLQSEGVAFDHGGHVDKGAVMGPDDF